MLTVILRHRHVANVQPDRKPIFGRLGLHKEDGEDRGTIGYLQGRHCPLGSYIAAHGEFSPVPGCGLMDAT